MKPSYTLLALCLLYSIISTNYFGGNFLPQSPQECINDGIVFILFALALILRECEKIHDSLKK